MSDIPSHRRILGAGRAGGREQGAESTPRRRWAIPRLVAGRLAHLNLRVRVGALVALAVGVTVAITSLATFLTIRVQLYDALDRSLEDRARALLTTAAGDPTQIVRFPTGAFAAADVRMAIVYPDGTPVSSTDPSDAPAFGPAEIAVAQGAVDLSVRTTTDFDGQEFRVVAVPALQQAETRAAFVLAQSTRATEHTLRSLGTALLVIGLVGVALAAYAGFLVARRGLRPVTDLTQAAEHVASTGELKPIPVRGTDELARLGVMFNAMLAAVERSRSLQRRLVADAGHELRTPLTSLRTNLDLLAQAENQVGLSAEDRRDLLGDVHAQVEELSGLVGDLVELSRDSVETSEGREVDMVEVVTTAVARARRRSPHAHFDVLIRPWTVFGDARSLERAVLNLLDNAGKWSPPGGRVSVKLSDGVITVTDEGPGIAESDLPFVFDRFYRAQDSRNMPGSGLGLAIVRQAAERHGGTVTAARAPEGGALLRLRLPHSSSVTHTEH